MDVPSRVRGCEQLSRSAGPWKNGDRIELSLPMSLHVSPMPDKESLQAAMHGPLVLAARFEEELRQKWYRHFTSEETQEPSPTLQFKGKARRPGDLARTGWRKARGPRGFTKSNLGVCSSVEHCARAVFRCIRRFMKANSDGTTSAVMLNISGLCKTTICSSNEEVLRSKQTCHSASKQVITIWSPNINIFRGPRWGLQGCSRSRSCSARTRQCDPLP